MADLGLGVGILHSLEEGGKGPGQLLETCPCARGQLVLNSQVVSKKDLVIKCEYIKKKCLSSLLLTGFPVLKLCK